MIEADDLDRIFDRLDALEDREATVIRMRFGLEPFQPMTLREVGENLGLTRERVRQLETQALQKLMHGVNELGGQSRQLSAGELPSGPCPCWSIGASPAEAPGESTPGLLHAPGVLVPPPFPCPTPTTCTRDQAFRANRILFSFRFHRFLTIIWALFS